MTGFIVLAIAMTIAVLALVLTPLLRKNPAVPARAVAAALVAAAAVGFGAIGLYYAWSNWSWRAPQAADTPEGMVSRLARRLEKNPNDLDGWLKLGRSYGVLEQFPLSVRAYQRADRLAGGKNAEALIGMAEALAAQDEKQLDGAAGQYIERAIVLDPKFGKAQFYGAAVAMRRGDLPLARQRFTTLLSLNPPRNVRPVLEQQIANIDRQLSSPAAAGVKLNVALAPALANKIPAQSMLFVLARSPQGGPPLAVKKLSAGRFPISVDLSDRDAMIAGRTLSSAAELVLVARISRSGTPQAQSGDLEGKLTYKPASGGSSPVQLTIDSVVP